MWKKVEYSKKRIERAGRAMANSTMTEAERIEHLQVIDNWRSAHAFPMNTFAINLRKKVEGIEGAMVVQRLKRLDTICDKLKRFPQMSLYRMQDLGGCRVIVPTIEDVYRVKQKIEKSRIRHELYSVKDYIREPNKQTGYRGIHLVYKYRSDRSAVYNGLFTEIQIRTSLQHLWATTVETVGLFTGEGLKYSQGSENWIEFFRLIALLFALKDCNMASELSKEDREKLVIMIASIDKEIKAFEKIATICVFSTRYGHINKNKKNGYYLLILNTETSVLTIKQFEGNTKGLNDANEEYNTIEAENKKGRINVVLVSAQSYESLVKAYPNYFANIKKFPITALNIMREFVE